MVASSPVDVEQAVALLAQGRLVAFPTETVYGLGANASDAAAVDAIFALKGRPRGHPLIVHLAAGSDPDRYFAREVPQQAYRLIEHFWPGPLTLVLQRQPQHAAAAAGQQDSIGMRCPAHPLAQQLLKTLAARDPNAGLAAPSANRFGHVSPTTAAHVRAEFGDTLAILDGGACPIGIESTILDLTRIDRLGAVLLRPGSVSRAMLAEVLGSEPASIDADAPRVSGSLASHYAPAKRLSLVTTEALAEIASEVAVWAFAPAPAGAARAAPWLLAPSDAAAYARQLYAVLRQLDRSNAVAIAVELPPRSLLWEGINDRLRRAATPT